MMENDTGPALKISGNSTPVVTIEFAVNTAQNIHLNITNGTDNYGAAASQSNSLQ